MRLGSLLSTFALIVATLGLPAQQLCGLGAPAGQRHAAVASSCCGADHCCPAGHCSCAVSPPGEADTTAVATPTTVTDGLVLALAPVPATGVPVDAGPAAHTVCSNWLSPTEYYASCLSDRAPPQA